MPPPAGDFLFSQALDGLELYGIRALRRTVQRHVAPPLYRAYVAGQLSEEALERLAVHVRLVAGEVQVGLRERVG